MNVRFFDPGKSYLDHKDEFDDSIQRVLTKGDLILREDVELFEENLARFVGTKHAIALNSGTDAIVLSLKALGMGDGAKIGLPAHTFKATCGAVLTVGAKPILFDMDEQMELNPDVDLFIPVHIAGEIAELPHSKRPFIEDSCQGLGAVKPRGITQCWSFYPAKILGAFGDAGAVTTNDDYVANYIRGARNHFKEDNKGFGINSRMDNLQAAILNVKIKYLPDYLARREEIANKYKGLKGVELPNYQQGRVWQDYIIRTPKRDELFDYLRENGVECLKNEYPFSPSFVKPPKAALYEAETLRLPCNPDLTDEEVDYVIEKVNAFTLL